MYRGHFRGYAECGCPIYDKGAFHDPNCLNNPWNQEPEPGVSVCKVCGSPYDAGFGYRACPRCGTSLGGAGSQ